MTVRPALVARITMWSKEVRTATVARDHYIVEAVNEGGSLREVGALAGLSHAGVKRIVERAK